MSVGADAVTAQPSEGPAATLAATVIHAAERHSGTAVRFKEGERWVTKSYAELGAAVTELARALIAAGIARGDRVAILSNTRPEWTYADLAIFCAGGVTVPVYQTNSPDECRYVLEHSGARLLFCEDGDQLAKIAEIRADLPALQRVVSFEQAGGEAISLENFRATSAEATDEALAERVAALGPEDLCTIVYTSGTTGNPKGCMLTHANLRAALDMVRERIDLGAEPASFYVFLPLAHVLTRLVQIVAIDAGAELAYWRRDPKALVQEVAEVKPTHLPAVPRVFEKIHQAATTRARDAGGVREKLFDWAVARGRAVREAERAGRRPGAALRTQHALADRLVLSKVRDLFGDRLKLAITGAAPIDEDVISFFHAAGVYVLEGYGMTETTSVATLNTLEEHRIGTVGKALPGCEIGIADDGEVLMRGPNVFRGYYSNEQATEETLRDGWLHSGDLGELDADGYLTITGRKKDLIVTSSGKNITPANIEVALAQSRWISQAVVFGDRRPYLTAMVTLDPDELPALAKQVGAEPDPAVLAKDARVRQELQRAVDEANSRFARIEQVKRFFVLDRELSLDEDELTPTLKVRRQAVYSRHGDAFERLYEDS